MTVSCELTAIKEHSDGYHYKVSVEEGLMGYCRVNISMLDHEDALVSQQGIDLTVRECRSLAAMLQAVAERLAD